jgi:Uma2 family endonuclease
MLPAEVERRRFTVEEYYRMAEAGILHEDDRVELIGGEIVEMVPIGSPHQSVVDRLTALMIRFAGKDYNVRVQGPIRLDERNEPEPDLALLRYREDFYAGAHPGPRDLVLLVEVAETSLGYDRRVKLPLYARFGVPEVWLVNLEEGVVEVYSEPEGNRYASCRTYGREEELRSATVNGLAAAAREVLGHGPVA